MLQTTISTPVSGDLARELVLAQYARHGMLEATKTADSLGLSYELCTCCGVETPFVDDCCVFCDQRLNTAAHG